MWYVLLLCITGIAISFFIYKLMGKNEQSAYKSEATVEASSLAMNLDLIMANHAIKMQTFEDHIDSKNIKSAMNKQVIQSAFQHSIFSSFSFLKYQGVDKLTGDVLAHRLYRVVADEKKATPMYGPDTRLHSEIAKATIQQMVDRGDKQSQFLVDVKGEVLYVVISRSMERDSLFFAFSGFAKNLFNDNFPVKTHIESVIYQKADNSYWHVVKNDSDLSFKKIPPVHLTDILKDKMIFEYTSRFGSGKYFGVEVLMPKSSSQKNLFTVVVFIAGVVITLLLSFLLHYLITRNIRIHNIVKERTSELVAESKKSKEAAIAKSRFLANISHEIRTPLNIVLGMTDLLSETSLTSMQKHYLNSINNSGQHLLHLINDILDMTRVDVSDVPFKPETTSLLKIFEESCLAVDELARNKNLDLYMDLDITMPNTIEIDHSRIRQILINLLSNAVKYTEKGFIEFSAVGKSQSETGNYVLEFRIKDSGIGISDKDKEEIFKAFFQVNSSIQRSQGGVGLGLSIVTSIVKRLGGTVDVQSTVGIGSTFIVTIPIAKRSQESWSSVMDVERNSKDKNIFISNDTILSGIFSKYMKSIQQPFVIMNNIQKFSVNTNTLEVANCVFIDMDTVRDFNRKMLGSLKYKKIILIGEPSDNQNTLPKKQFSNVYLWPNKLILPTHLFDALEQKSDVVLKSLTTLEPCGLLLKNDEDLNILIVDDDISNKILFEAYCAAKKWNVNFASNGQDAIENHLSRKHFDILITDLQMPIMDGFTLLQQLNEDARGIFKPDYTIVLSADSTEETISMSKTLNVDAFLAKPIRKADFLLAVEKANTANC